MAYEAGDRYRELAGVPEDATAWDVGLTGRPVRLLWELASGQPRCILPPSIAPVQAVIGASAAAEVAVPPDVRTLVAPDSDSSWWRDWHERGVPAFVGRSRRGRRSLVGAGAWEDSDESVDVLIARSSGTPVAPVLRDPVNGGPGFEVLCDRCAEARTLAAPVLPDQRGLCESCASEGRSRLTASTDQVY